MRTRLIPGTDLAVSEIGFGCGGNAGLMVRGDPAAQDAAVARALELGITYFDTAPDYGNGAAEIALGRALKAAPGECAVITTKIEVREGDLDDVAGHVVRSAQASMRRLGRDHLDILQIHNGPTTAPPSMQGDGYHHLWIEHFLGPRGAIEGLRRLIADGSVRHAGFVCRGGDDAEVRTLLGAFVFRMVNLAYSLLRPDGLMAIEAAADHSCGVAVFSPLAGGLLAGNTPAHPLARPVDATRSRHGVQPDLGFLTEDGGSLARAAYRYVLSQPCVTTVIGGFSSMAQLEEIAGAPDLSPLSPDLLARVERALSKEPALDA